MMVFSCSLHIRMHFNRLRNRTNERIERAKVDTGVLTYTLI